MEIQKVKLQMIKDGSTIYTLEKITTPKDVVKLVNAHEKYDMAPTGKIIVIGVNQKNQINTYTEIATGTAEYTNFNMSDIFKPILLSNSTKFILTHNHPSGDTTPSEKDLDVTEKVKKAAKIMGVQFLDYIIIGDNDNYTSVMSMKESE